jgi:DNA polymerase-3 subunit gamma/tau
MLPVCIIYGPSGVGKTTIARLIAMWQCCTSLINNEPCGECANCVAIINNANPDVYELDGGTYTGIEAIKLMLEGMEYSTLLSTKKIYILDEVHMLSKSSISALLKKFEEPLDGVQFILATTNIEKLPDTIISRAFRIPLNSISNELITNNLAKIAKDNNIIYDDKVLDYISDMSNGSVRQSLSLFEQLAILCNNNITKNPALKMFGLSDSDMINDIVEILQNKTPAYLMEYLSLREKSANLIKQVLGEIQNRLRAGKASDRLIKIAYKLADASMIIHKSPYSEYLIEICLGNSMFVD